jgi:hypothetical protein
MNRAFSAFGSLLILPRDAAPGSPHFRLGKRYSSERRVRPAADCSGSRAFGAKHKQSRGRFFAEIRANAFVWLPLSPVVFDRIQAVFSGLGATVLTLNMRSRSSVPSR